MFKKYILLSVKLRTHSDMYMYIHIFNIYGKSTLNKTYVIPVLINSFRCSLCAFLEISISILDKIFNRIFI